MSLAVEEGVPMSEQLPGGAYGAGAAADGEGAQWFTFWPFDSQQQQPICAFHGPGGETDSVGRPAAEAAVQHVALSR